MNNELYVNDTTKTELVADVNVKLKDEDKISLWLLQSEIEERNEDVISLKILLNEYKENIRNKHIFSVLNLLIIMLTFYINFKFIHVVLLRKIIVTLFETVIATVWMQAKFIKIFGTFKENKLNIKEVTSRIKNIKDKIKDLEKNLEKSKENKEEKIPSPEDMIKFSVINYPERTMEERFDSEIELSSKVKKIGFKDDRTAK